MRNIFLYGFSTGMRQKRVAAIVYMLQFCLALTLGMQVHSVLESSIGHSLEISKLLAQYDHTVWTDFLKIHGASITPLIGQLRWLLLVWLIFSVFINAGLLFCASSEGSSKQTISKAFWQGAVEYFFPFLKISLISWLLVLLWTAVVLTPIALFLEPSLEYFPTEQYSVWLVLCLLFVYLIGLAVLFVGSVICRFEKIRSGESISRCFRNGWKIFWNNKRGFLGLLIVFMAFQFVLVALYWVLDAWIGMTSTGGILLLFVLQQTFVFFRIQMRQMMYAGVCRFARLSTEIQ